MRGVGRVTCGLCTTSSGVNVLQGWYGVPNGAFSRVHPSLQGLSYPYPAVTLPMRMFSKLQSRDLEPPESPEVVGAVWLCQWGSESSGEVRSEVDTEIRTAGYKAFPSPVVLLKTSSAIGQRHLDSHSCRFIKKKKNKKFSCNPCCIVYIYVIMQKTIHMSFKTLFFHALLCGRFLNPAHYLEAMATRISCPNVISGA